MRLILDLEEEVEALEGLDLDELRAVWNSRFGPAPELRSVELLRLLLAWRVQAQALGGLDAESRRRLFRKGPVEAEGRQLGIGAILRRDWQGRTIEVVVEAGGFRLEDRVYRSLSAAASAATGTRWNGPRFFGLREDKS